MHPTQAHPRAVTTAMKEANPGTLQRRDDEGLGATLELVPVALEVADRAPRDTGEIGELLLRPVEQRARGATLFGA